MGTFIDRRRASKVRLLLGWVAKAGVLVALVQACGSDSEPAPSVTPDASVGSGGGGTGGTGGTSGAGGTSDAGGAANDASSSDGFVAEATVGVEGGSLQSLDGRVTLTIPAGALISDTRITISVPADPPRGALGPVYEIGPTGTTLAVPATLMIAYEPSMVGSADPRTLILATFDGEWDVIDNASSDPDASTVSGELGHFSPYAVVAASFTTCEECPAGYYPLLRIADGCPSGGLWTQCVRIHDNLRGFHQCADDCPDGYFDFGRTCTIGCGPGYRLRTGCVRLTSQLSTPMCQPCPPGYRQVGNPAPAPIECGTSLDRGCRGTDSYYCQRTCGNGRCDTDVGEDCTICPEECECNDAGPGGSGGSGGTGGAGGSGTGGTGDAACPCDVDPICDEGCLCDPCCTTGGKLCALHSDCDVGEACSNGCCSPCATGCGLGVELPAGSNGCCADGCSQLCLSTGNGCGRIVACCGLAICQ